MFQNDFKEGTEFSTPLLSGLLNPILNNLFNPHTGSLSFLYPLAEIALTLCIAVFLAMFVLKILSFLYLEKDDRKEIFKKSIELVLKKPGVASQKSKKSPISTELIASKLAAAGTVTFLFTFTITHTMILNQNINQKFSSVHSTINNTRNETKPFKEQIDKIHVSLSNIEESLYTFDPYFPWVIYTPTDPSYNAIIDKLHSNHRTMVSNLVNNFFEHEENMLAQQLDYISTSQDNSYVALKDNYDAMTRAIAEINRNSKNITETLKAVFFVAENLKEIDIDDIQWFKEREKRNVFQKVGHFFTGYDADEAGNEGKNDKKTYDPESTIYGTQDSKNIREIDYRVHYGN